MDLLENPFYILKATPRDNRRRVTELAEERSLLLESNQCMQARSDLTNPRKRLSVELAWLPGVGPKRATEVLTVLENSASDLLGMDTLTAIARANLLAAGLARLSGTAPDDVAEWILELAWAFEDIDSEEVCALINEERIVSGFPEVTDLSMVETEIQERRRHYRQAIKSALKNLSPEELVQAVTLAVESATDNGEAHGPILIDDLIDSYEVEVQSSLERKAGNIETLVEKLRAAADAELPNSTLAPMVEQIIQLVKDWDTVAQPIQISTKSRGLDHGASHRVAGLVRGVAIHLFNEHGTLELAQRLISMLQDVFAEVVQVAERTAEDASALDDIAEQWKLSGHLDPISNFCRAAVENAEKDPSSADKDAQRVIDAAPQLLSKLSSNSVSAEIVSRGKDEIALTLMHCAVVYGNKTDKWKPCVSILNEALKHASSSDVIGRIEKNLATVRNNRLFGDLSPISSAPSLHTINGTGFTLYGATDADRETGSYLSTYYFVFFFVPLFPIRRYRVLAADGGYRFLGEAPLRALDKWHVFIAIVLISLLVFYIVSKGNSVRSVSSPDRSYESRSSSGALAREIEDGITRVRQLETQLREMDEQLEDYDRRMKSYRASGMTDEYNMLVPPFNSLVSERKDLYEEYGRLIDEVNSKVKRYNTGYR